MIEQTRENDNCTIIANKTVLPNINSQYFSLDHWQHQNAVIGQSKGRNAVYFIQHDKYQLVLRHYYRGGAVARLVKDRYFYRSLKQTRAHAEFHLLLHLQKLNLPAPLPVAARIVRYGFTYTADLITQKISQAQDLFAFLTERPLDDSQWSAVGSTIAQFHCNNIYHADLNIHNLMIDNENKIWLIDFDRGAIKETAGKWKQNNLDRLQRSLRKEKAKNINFNWKENDWNTLMKGYKSN